MRRSSGPVGPRGAAAMLGLWVMSCATAFCSPAADRATVLEAEHPLRRHDIGGEPIAAEAAGSCSGGEVLVGLDRPGEYVEYAVPNPSSGSYVVEIVCRGEIAAIFEVTLSTVDGTRPGEALPGSAPISLRFLGSGFG